MYYKYRAGICTMVLLTLYMWKYLTALKIPAAMAKQAGNKYKIVNFYNFLILKRFRYKYARQPCAFKAHMFNSMQNSE